MIGLAISLLWLAIGVIICGAILYILFWAIKMFFPIPPKAEMAIWAVFGILILIYLLEALVGGGGLPHLSLRG